MRRLLLLAVVSSSGWACGWGNGSSWVGQPVEEERAAASYGDPVEPGRAKGPPRTASRTLGGPRAMPEATEGDRTGGGGHALGKFRNTYYDFPRETDHTGDPVGLMSASCETIAKVPRTFYEAVCVQGSGSLARGGTVSYAKRDCACAETCPRTGQKICFEALDPARFPFGRGAAGRPITPFRTIAADTSVLPMGTVVYIPELDGVPRGDTGEPLEGCFVVEDRGLRVKGEHVDIFTGSPQETAILNAKVPSNQGVTVVVSSPRCAHLGPR